MTYSREELSTFTLQKLASIYPQDKQEEELLHEIFDKRASVSSYFQLTTLVDVKSGWQEQILQSYIDKKRESMPPENPVELSPEDESQLDAATVTKEKELALQEKLDAANAKRKGIQTEEEEVEETEPVDVVEATLEPEAPVATEEEAPRKRGRKAIEK